MMNFLRRITPAWGFTLYHKSLSILANLCYGKPSKKLIVIGVTGTNGKTSTCDYIARVLEGAGHKVGVASTAMFKVADKEWLNDKKMTMLGRFALQKLLREMVTAGCRYAVIETSSQGIEQHRHLGIHYDVCVFTNLTPEHIEAHGGFENYKKAKLKLFKHLEKLPVKKLRHPEGNEGSQVLPRDPSQAQDDDHSIIARESQDDRGNPVAELRNSQDDVVKKAIIVNGDDKFAGEFLNFNIEQKIVFGLENNLTIEQFNNLIASDIKYNPTGVSFVVEETQFNLQLFGKFSVYNSLASIAVAKSQGVAMQACKNSLENITGVPGRMEFIETEKDFKVLVDYAPEPESMRQLFETIKAHKIATGKIIHVFGSCGGGRDVSRRPILGELSAKHADVLIVTNEDPYDDDPQMIIDSVASGAIEAGKILDKDIFKILDRREAIKFAIEQAQAGDLVLLTGKGCEQAICVAGGCKIQWDERETARQLLSLKK
jgi:UDP-N-acetylmuramoyl-L-alanyl-D-glutamate--2,6-diaminopimelate ligase